MLCCFPTYMYDYTHVRMWVIPSEVNTISGQLSQISLKLGVHIVGV